MSEGSVARRAFGSWRDVGQAVLILVLVCAVVGGLTSPAQQFLPDALRSLANAVGPWLAAVEIAVYAGRSRLVLSLILGVVGFVLLNVSYAVVSVLRGYPYTPANFWSIVAIPSGIAVGLSAAWLRSPRLILLAVGLSILGAVVFYAALGLI